MKTIKYQQCKLKRIDLRQAVNSAHEQAWPGVFRCVRTYGLSSSHVLHEVRTSHVYCVEWSVKP